MQILALLSLLLAFQAPPVPVAPVPVRPAVDPATLRDELALRINTERQRGGLPPVAPSAALDKVAQDRAEEIKAKGALPNESEAFTLFSRIQLRMARAGYSAHGWTESLVGTAGDPDAVIAAWKDDPSTAQAMDSDYQDLGVGVADLNGVPLYVFLFAWPRSEYYARETAGLTDLQAAREAMLAIVNAARLVEGRSPLVLDPHLSAAAQAHAQDMLARTYYAHQSPDGSTPRQRVRTAGVAANLVGENLAAGQTSVENVMEAWLHSVDHRRNILDPRFTHLGVGIAVGSYQHKYKVLWVQDFANPGTKDVALPNRKDEASDLSLRRSGRGNLSLGHSVLLATRTKESQSRQTKVHTAVDRPTSRFSSEVPAGTGEIKCLNVLHFPYSR